MIDEVGVYTEQVLNKYVAFYLVFGLSNNILKNQYL